VTDADWGEFSLEELKVLVYTQSQNQLERADLLAIIRELILRVEGLVA